MKLLHVNFQSSQRKKPDKSQLNSLTQISFRELLISKYHFTRYILQNHITFLPLCSSWGRGWAVFVCFCMIHFFFLALLVPKSSIIATSTFVIFFGSGVPVSRTSTFWYTLGEFIHFVRPASL